MISAKDLIGEIAGKSGKKESEIKRLIKDKQVELSGLVSEEGAAYIVGRELGIDLIKEKRRDLKIKNIVADMRSVDIVARVAGMYEPREFEKNGKKGKVASMILADDSGTIRLPLWNEEVNLITSLGLSRDSVVEVTGAWAKTDQRSGTELRLGNRGKIRKLEGKEAGDLAAARSYPDGFGEPPAAERADIASLKEGSTAAVKGVLVQVYKKKPYFEACPQCGSRAEEAADGKFACKSHGEVAPGAAPLLSGVLDDGTGNIRVVFFRDQAEKVFGKSAEDLRAEFLERGMDAFWEKMDILGSELVIEGRVKMNDFSKEPEIMASGVREADAAAEAAKLLGDVGKKDDLLN